MTAIKQITINFFGPQADSWPETAREAVEREEALLQEWRRLAQRLAKAGKKAR